MAINTPAGTFPPSLRLPATAQSRLPSPSFFFELLLVAIAIGASILTKGWVDDVGRPPYQEFLRLQWLLMEGGKGLHLDPASLPIAPLVYVASAALGGPSFAERGLPIVLDVAILLVLTRFLLSDQPLLAKLIAGLLLIVSPLFYLLQRQLDVQLYVLFLGLQLVALRSFRQQPAVLSATAAVLVNVLMSLTTYMALPAIVAAMIYLVVLAGRSEEVRPPMWGALMWLYVPFSFAGYALWAVFWTVAGSRVTTSYFIPSTDKDPSYLHELLASLRGDVAVPLLALIARAIATTVFLHHAEQEAAPRRRRNLTWVIVAFMAFGLGLLALQTVVQHLPLQLEVFSFSLMLLVPLAIAELHDRARSLYRELTWPLRLALIAAGLAVLTLPLQAVARPASAKEGLPPADTRQAAEAKAAHAFRSVDPGGRVLVDPRFAATFVRDAGIDPSRLVTPFDKGFEQLVANPPNDVKTIVVTESLDDDVAGNFPAGRFANLLPNATLVAEGRSGADNKSFVRVFKHENLLPPDQNATFVERDPAVTVQENTILDAILSEMQKNGGLPIRPDGWAYAIDLGNLMVYSAKRGDIKLFTQMSDIVEQQYLMTKTDDINALYTVAWRHRPDKPNEASGTTETLRMVEAYWTAGTRWNNDYYRRIAYLMALSYARHQWSDEFGQGWYIRNYYNYETKEYATNTYLVDYNPDILRKVAEYWGDKDLLAVANAAAAFATAAQLDNGLVHEMYQPEISTLYANITYFSPNGIIQLIDSVEAILGVSQLYAPDRARRTYDLAKNTYFATPVHALSNQFLMNGVPSESKENAPAVYAYLVRLGLRLGDTDWPRQLITDKLRASQLYQGPLPVNKDFNWFFAWTSSLLAIREYQESAVPGVSVAPTGPTTPSAQSTQPATVPAPAQPAQPATVPAPTQLVQPTTVPAPTQISPVPAPSAP